MFSKPLKELLSAEVEIDDAALISVDSKGTDIRVRQGAQVKISSYYFFSTMLLYFFWGISCVPLTIFEIMNFIFTTLNFQNSLIYPISYLFY